MPPTSAVLFRNVRIFNGTEKLSAPMNVLVKGNTIEKVSSASIPVRQETTAVTIDGNGRTLMPGLIDAHAHIMFAAIPLALALTADVGYLHQVAGKEAVKCIEHGQLADEATEKLTAEKGTWWSLQPFLDDEDAVPFPEVSANRKKQLQMSAGTDDAYKLAIKYKIRISWGTDAIFDTKLASKQGKLLAKMTRW